jgi:hypothetical protein
VVARGRSWGLWRRSVGYLINGRDELVIDVILS